MTTFSEFAPAVDTLSLAPRNLELLDEEDPNPFKHWDLLYVATPLNAEQLRIEVEGDNDEEAGEYVSLYMNFAFDQVDQRLRDTFIAPPDGIDQTETWAATRKLLQAGVYGELFKSMATSAFDNAAVDLSVDRNKELLDLATWGNALPDQLIELLLRNPSVGHLEIAKQTSPLDWRAMKNINIVIDMAMADAGFSFLAPDQQEIGHSIMRFDYMQDPRVALMTRSAIVGWRHVDNGAFRIMQRDVFVANLKNDRDIIQEITLWTHDPSVEARFRGGCEVVYDGGYRLPRFVEGESQVYGNGHVGAVMPAVRTYNADFIPLH